MSVPAAVTDAGESRRHAEPRHAEPRQGGSRHERPRGADAFGGPKSVGGGSVADTVARLASLPGVGTAGDIAAASRPVHPVEPQDSETLSPSVGADERVLPVASALAELLPWGGLRRGSTVSVSGSTSLLLAFLAEATARGSWAAVVGMPELGVAAARELGVAVRRLALIPRPGADFAQVTAALLDGIDLVVVPADGAGRTRDPSLARRLSARARNRGAVLLTVGSWPGTEVELRCAAENWSGADDGYGYLTQREVLVETAGRRGPARTRRTSLLLPGPDGTIAWADPEETPSPLREV